ncbi:helix-turn-helix domain-containing protein [Lactococcus lactis]|uniref:helix-turn-helix domain-containing protein n=1 Tax=Lactococcus lactis TaxID=1358 RepID=UPI00288D1074|nr:helix-turn-helix transcriptional regulator [Lactococcus lactis]MDT2867519.1 helix-turn-helix transcriptional regulator [Lactococcus lactis]
MSMEYFGSRLKALRKSAGMTQVELANKLQLASGTISAYEQGLKYPSIEVLIKICDILNTSSDYLLGITSDLSSKMELKGLTDEQIQPFLQLISIVEQYNNLKDTSTT